MLLLFVCCTSVGMRIVLHVIIFDVVLYNRGMKAFISFAPREVVQILVAGLYAQQRLSRRDRSRSSIRVFNSRATDDISLLNELKLLSRRIITILQMDIANFSTMCEKVSPDDLISVMSEYLESMCSVISKHRGTLDKV